MKRVRFAPSPTGHLHIGSARTALFNFLYARSPEIEGKFILRVEDTDIKRSSQEKAEEILRAMKWLGLEWDEGPYYQSRRFPEYREKAAALLAAGKVYRCFCTPEEIEQNRSEPGNGEKVAWKYDRRCYRLSRGEIEEKIKRGAPFVLRFYIPEGTTAFKDRLHKEMKVDNSELEDFVVLKSDGSPTYHLSVVVDDIDMGITDVIRGDDHISNTFKQALLYRALDTPPPRYAHLPLILGEDRKKLSKRHGETSVLEFKKKGYLPEALLTYLSQLSWLPADNKEIFDIATLSGRFALHKLSKSSPVFDYDKLNFLNARALQKKPSEEILRLLEEEDRFRRDFAPFPPEKKRAFIDLIKSRMKTLEDLKEKFYVYLKGKLTYGGEALERFRADRRAPGLLREFSDALKPLHPFDARGVEQTLRACADRNGVEAADLIHPCRFALVAAAVSPSIFEVFAFLGKAESIKRIESFRHALAAPGSVSPSNFIRDIIRKDIAAGKNNRRVHTRFPPEPNGYLHIGHAKSICLNFGLAAEFGGQCNLRFDDTNPTKEDVEYVESIKADVRWLGFDWEDRLYFASDYYERLYRYAVQLIESGHAYVCSLGPEEIREYRGVLTAPGKDSPYRNRSIEENLRLFEGMRAGEFADGAQVLRAKIDMASPNLNLRDPVIYRILRAEHHRTGSGWCIYPMYDFAHGLSDSIEGITHSICTLEFEDHRPLYDWFLDKLQVDCHPQQIEFARLNMNYTVMSKRKLLELVEQGYVQGWDDPRIPTISGLRRRGYTPEAIRDFLERVGVAKASSVADAALLEHCLREDLNKKAPRRMAVLHPLEVVIDNYPEDRVEELEAANNPEDPGMGTRRLPFSRILYIEREDFREDPPKKFFRLAPGREVRLKYAYLIRCVRVVKDEKTGQVTRLHCTYDPQSRGGEAPDGRRVRGTLHWVSAPHAREAEVRLYDRLFSRENPEEPGEGEDFKDSLNPDSLKILQGCRVEPALAGATAGSRFQFLRHGYFCVDTGSPPGEGIPVFNRAVPLRDSWARIEKPRGGE